MAKASIVLCTYNRSESLRETIRSLQRQALKPPELEIVVVDNNSKDTTKQTVLQETKESPGLIRYVFEAQQGLSYARNRGIRETSGDFIAFIDDDEMADPGWVQNLHNAFLRYQADCVGGKILLKWPSPPPEWLLQHRLEGQLGFLDRGPAAIVADVSTGEGFLFGGNMAFSRKVFADMGEFRTDLGVVGSKAARGEDSEMIQRLLKAGKKVVYTPHAVVYHKVPPERMRKSYFRRMSFNSYRALTTMSAPATKHVQKRIPLWLIKECSENGLGVLWAYGRGQADMAFRREIVFWSQLGQIAGALDRPRKRGLPVEVAGCQHSA